MRNVAVIVFVVATFALVLVGVVATASGWRAEGHGARQARPSQQEILDLGHGPLTPAAARELIDERRDVERR